MLLINCTMSIVRCYFHCIALEEVLLNPGGCQHRGYRTALSMCEDLRLRQAATRENRTLLAQVKALRELESSQKAYYQEVRTSQYPTGHPEIEQVLWRRLTIPNVFVSEEGYWRARCKS